MSEARKSVLYDRHLQLTDKSLAPFAGYLMPLWYTSISAEHQAVRETAGLFDCTHMGVWRVRRTTAARFLDILTTNKAANLKPGRAQYSYILDENGAVLDDIIVYRRSEEEYLVVVNAANNDKIARWYDSSRPLMSDYITEFPEITDLRDPKLGSDGRVDIALQGPQSKAILSSLLPDDSETRETFETMKPFQFIETEINGIELTIATTGYTGAKTGYELLVPPDRASEIWDIILDTGKTMGIQPCGLGARDSLRIEAGLPLYGHELAGEHNISPFEAGYGWAVKLDKEFFIGQAAMREVSETYTMAVQRLEMPGRKGVRPIREKDGVLDRNGKCIGWVLSCAKVGEQQIALAYLQRGDDIAAGAPVGLYYLARSPRHVEQGKKEAVALGETLTADLEGTIVERMAKF